MSHRLKGDTVDLIREEVDRMSAELYTFLVESDKNYYDWESKVKEEFATEDSYEDFLDELEIPNVFNDALDTIDKGLKQLKRIRALIPKELENDSS